MQRFDRTNRRKNSYAKIVTKTGEIAEKEKKFPDHGTGIDVMNELLFNSHALTSLDEIDGVGHRVVQGADLFNDAVLVDDDVLQK